MKGTKQVQHYIQTGTLIQAVTGMVLYLTWQRTNTPIEMIDGDYMITLRDRDDEDITGQFFG